MEPKKPNNKLTCMCCGKISTVKPSEKNMSAVYVECGYCGYEHVVEIRAGKIAKVSAP